MELGEMVFLDERNPVGIAAVIARLPTSIIYCW